MLKHRLLAASTLLFLLLGFLCVSALEERDESYPNGCTSLLTLDVTQASATSADLLGTLESWAASADASLYLVRVANGDYTANRDLVALGGPDRDRPARPIRWLKPGLSGSVHPSSPEAQAFLNAPYCTSATEAEIESLRAALHEDGAALTAVWPLTWRNVTTQMLLTTGALVPLATALAVCLSLMLATQLAASVRRRVAYLEGVPGPSLLLLELRGLAPPLAVASLAGLTAPALVVLARGRPDLIVTALGVMAASAIAVLGALAAVAGVVVALVWPRRADVTARRAPSVGFGLPAQAIKLLALLLAALALPSLIQGLVDMRAAERNHARWTALTGYVTVRVSPSASQEAMHAAEAAFRAVVRDREAAEQTALSLTIAETSDAGIPHGPIVIADRTFLNRLGEPPSGEGWQPRAAADLPDGTRSFLEVSLPLWLEPGSPPPAYYVVSGPVPAILPERAGDLGDVENAVVVVPDQIGSLNGEFLLSAASSGNVLFSDRGALRRAMDAHHLGGLALSYDEAAGAGLLRAQLASQSVGMRTLGVALVLIALVMGTLLAASVSAAQHATRIVAQRTAGATWTRIVRPRLHGELVGVAAVLAVVAVLRSAIPLAQVIVGIGPLPFLLACGVGLLHLGAAAVAHVAAARAAFTTTISRRIR